MTKSDLLFLASVLTLPLQLNKFFFPDFSFVLGIPIDYRAISIYFSDFFIVAYVFAYFIENRHQLPKIYKTQRNFVLALMLLNFYLLLSSLALSIDKLPSIIFNLKTLEFSLFAVFGSLSLSKKQTFKWSLNLIAVSVIWQSALAVFQFILQKSLGFWILGERNFGTLTPSIAHVNFLGSQWLRPYGAFPHPNVLAAYLLIALILIYSYKTQTKNLTWLRPTALAMSLSGVFITFSKAAYLSLLAAIVVNSRDLKYALFKIIVSACLLVAFTLTITEGQIASITERFTLAKAAYDINLKNPLFGIGSNNFILELSRLNLFSISEVRLLQPVHNVFLLILAENGIVGLLLFAYLLYTIFKNATASPKIALTAAILIFLSVDHFLWTLHQGRFLFFLTSAYILSPPNA